MWGKTKNQPGPDAADSPASGPKPSAEGASGPCGHGCGCHSEPKPDAARAPDEYGDTGEPACQVDPDAAAARAGGDALGRLEAERDEWKSKAQRVMADFQNYQRRAFANEEQAREQAVRAVVSSLVPVLDHFQLALMVDAAKTSAAQVVQGVTVIRDEMLKVLAQHGVVEIAPKPGDEFDPSRHEAIMQQAAEGIEPGRIAMMLQPGFLVKDRLLRPAKVAVTPSG